MRKEINGFDGQYKIDINGVVYSTVRGNEKIIVSKHLTAGYPIVRLTKNKKRKPYLLHRLLAIAFIPNPNNLPQVNHKNAIKSDFRIENLEWCTAKYNKIHAVSLGLSADNSGDKNGRSKLTEKQAKIIKTSTCPSKSLSLIFNVSQATIRDIRSSYSWRHI